MKKIFFLIATIFATTISFGQNIPTEGSMFIDFTIQENPDDANSIVSFSKYVGKGKITIVDFWASWCGPCRKEIPYIKKAYDALPKDKVTVLSVAVYDKLEYTLAAAKELNITWEQIVNAGQVPVKLYGITGVPHIIVFAPDGKILKRGLRGDDILSYTQTAVKEYFK